MVHYVIYIYVSMHRTLNMSVLLHLHVLSPLSVLYFYNAMCTCRFWKDTIILWMPVVWPHTCTVYLYVLYIVSGYTFTYAVNLMQLDLISSYYPSYLNVFPYLLPLSSLHVVNENTNSWRLCSYMLHVWWLHTCAVVYSTVHVVEHELLA